LATGKKPQQKFMFFYFIILTLILFSFVIHKLGKGKYMVQSIPGELSMEETNILSAASNTELGCVTQSQLIRDLG